MKVNKKIITLIILVLSVFIVFSVVRIKTTLNSYVVDNNTTDIHINNKDYEYNEDLFNILVLGVDLEGNVKEAKPIGQRGQADVIYLVSINRKTKDVSVLTIPRDTMINVTHLDENGNYVGTFYEQITLQHAIGSSEKDSCEIMSQTVSDLLNRIPIHRYVALSYSAIPTINDAIGGVDVVMDSNYVDETLASWYSGFVPGATVHLNGELAHLYIRVRNLSVFNSAEERMKRQENYVEQYISRAKSEIKKNPFVLLSLYSKVNKVIETNVSLFDCIALIPFIQNLNFENVYSLSGNRTMGQYVELHLDQNELVNTIKNVFYIEKKGE